MQKHYRSNNLCIYGGFKRVLQKSNYHKEHLSLILVWQQEESENGGVGDLVVKGLTVKVKESWVDTDVVSKGGKKKKKKIESWGIQLKEQTKTHFHWIMS